MGMRKGESRPQTGNSRSNRRIQELEERVAVMAKELRQIHEMLGTKVDTKELLACVGQRVQIKDTTGELNDGVLEQVGKWTISVIMKNGSPTIFFKGNLVRVTPVEATDER